MNKRWRIISIVLWILIWQLAAWVIDNSIFLVGPWEVLSALVRSLPDPDFWLRIVHSWLRIAVGFTSALILGIFLGALSCRRIVIREFLGPAVQLMKSIPVASVVILLLLWAGSRHLSAVISFVVVFPPIYFATVEGIRHTDPGLLEVAEVFCMPFVRKVWYLYRPSVLPYLASACKSAVGMSWKSGAAAEVIGIPEGTIGERLYLSKIYLDTAQLFAWTAVILILSMLSERIVLWLLKRAGVGRCC